MLELNFSGAGTQGYSSSKYASEISVTIYNPNLAKINYIKIKFYACVSNGGSAGTSNINYYLNDLYIDSSSLDLTSSSSEWVKTLYLPSSISSSKYLTLTFKLDGYTSNYPPVFWSISHSDSGGTVAPTEYTHTIYYYKDGSYYTELSTKSTSTSVSMSLKSLPSTTNVPGTSSNFTITGDKNGGVSNTSLTVTKTPYTKTTWNGWYKGSNGNSGTRYSGSLTISTSAYFNAVSSITYPVEYTNNTLAYLQEPTRNSDTLTYTVTLDSNNGTNSTSQQITKTIPYRFSHWSSTASGGTTYKETLAFTSAKTVYAQWSEDTNNITTGSITLPTPSRNSSYAYRTVTFDDNGGICSTESLISTNKTTYKFKNWKDSSGNTTYDAGTSYTPSKSITLIAQWTPTSTGYNAIILPTATRTGYSFNGWQDKSSGNIYDAGSSYIPPSDEITLTASWSGLTYEVKYNGNGHTDGSMSNSIHTIGATEPGLSENKYKKEYTLSFNTNTNGSSLLPSGYVQLDYVESNSLLYVDTEYYLTSNNMKIEAKFMITENYTYNALWGCEETNSGPWSLTMLMNSVNPFTLGIWSGSSPGGSNMGAIPVIKNTIHTLSCETNNGTITYSCDENTGTLYTDSALCKSKSMYLFTINSAGTGTTNQASKMRIYYFKLYDNNELKRNFIPCKRVSDNTPGLYDLITQSFYRSNSGIDLIPGNEITSSGGIDDMIVSYAFQGWYSNSSCSGDPITQAYDLTTAGKTYNVYAKWTLNDFTLPTPKREGYIFLGWYDSQGSHITNNFLIASDLSLTALWIKDESNNKKIIIYTNNDWKKAIALIYKNNTWKEYDFNIK